MLKEIPATSNGFHWEHVHNLLWSYEHFLGKPLFDGHSDNPSPSQAELAQVVYSAPFALVSHGVESEPVFNYANKTALFLFAMDWTEFTKTPSKYSAESVSRVERADLLARVTRDNYIDDYRGVRIAKNGVRFLIEQAVVWNVVDEQLNKRGQAAMFSHWQFL